MPMTTLDVLWLKWPYVCFSALVGTTNHPGDKDREPGFRVQNRRAFMMDGVPTNCQSGVGTGSSGLGSHDFFPETAAT